MRSAIIAATVAVLLVSVGCQQQNLRSNCSSCGLGGGGKCSTCGVDGNEGGGGFAYRGRGGGGGRLAGGRGHHGHGGGGACATCGSGGAGGCESCGGVAGPNGLDAMGGAARPAFVGHVPPGYLQQSGPAGPPSASYAYPYYTTRAPRDFLMANPPSIGP